MTTSTPKPPSTPPTPPAPPAPKPEEPEAVLTIADEQRERSDEIYKEGVEKWKAAHDERDPADKPQAVPGVSPKAA